MSILVKRLFVIIPLLAAVCSAQDETLFGPLVEYTDWLQDTQYEKSTFLANPADPTKGIMIHWRIEDETIHLAVAAKAQGWAGFGIAEAGSMRGADTVMFSAESNELVDGYVLDDLVKPFPDACQSWTLLNSTIGEEFIMFQASRALNTGDTQDHAFVNDKEDFLPATRVIAAWGDTVEPSFHGSNTALGSIRFFADDANPSKKFASIMKDEAEGSFLLGASDFTIPENETTYAEFCLSADDLMAQGVPMDKDLHMIGIEDMIDPRARAHVHHFLVFGTTIPFHSAIQSCDDGIFFAELLYLWAPGSDPSLLPENVGIPLGGSSGYVALQIQIHYDNPAMVPDVVDSSGVRIHFTSQKREFDLGVLSVGDPGVQAQPRILSEKGGFTQHGFTCPSDCTNNYFQETVTVFGEALHMHQNGKSISNEQIRDGAVIRRGVGQYYDFEAQGGLMVAQEPFFLQPGDSFRTTCTFDAEPGERWGQASSEEMCIAFLFYYPRQAIPLENVAGTVIAQYQPTCGFGFEDFLPGCGADYTVTPDFTSMEQIDRDFGTPNGICGIGVSSQELEASSAPLCSSLAFLATFMFVLLL